MNSRGTLVFKKVYLQKKKKKTRHHAQPSTEPGHLSVWNRPPWRAADPARVGRVQCEPGDVVTAESTQAFKHCHPAEAPTG